MGLRPGLYDVLDESLKWSCGFGENPTDPPCMDPAKWHGIIFDGANIWQGGAMACCDEHVKFMRRHADYVHEMGSACFLPGSKFVWPENACYMPDESVESLAAKVAPIDANV